MKGRHVAPARRWLAALGAAAAVVAFGAVARAGPETPTAPRCVRLRLVDPDGDARALVARLGDVLAADFPQVDLGTAPSLAGDRLFSAADPDAGCLTAWVVVEPTRALVRVASAGRCRYVFREVGVEHPLSDLDRERVAQVAKAALSAIGDSPEASECAPPPVVGRGRLGGRARVGAARRASAGHAHAHGDRDAGSSSPTVVVDRDRRLRMVGRITSAVNCWQGPALLMAVERAPPGGSELLEATSLTGRYLLPHASNGPGDTMQTIAGRAGVSLRASPAVRLGLGVGVDREEATYQLLSPGAGALASRYTNWQEAARVFARVSTRWWKGFSLSETLLLDAVHSPDLQNTFRIGLAFEGWWRS